MGHKQLDEESKKRAQESIQFFEGMIARIQLLKSGGRDAIKAGMDAIRELEFDAGYKKDHHLKQGKQDSFVLAHGFMKMQEAYQNIITLFEAPDNMSNLYREEIKKVKGWLGKFEPPEHKD